MPHLNEKRCVNVLIALDKNRWIFTSLSQILKMYLPKASKINHTSITLTYQDHMLKVTTLKKHTT